MMLNELRLQLKQSKQDVLDFFGNLDEDYFYTSWQQHWQPAEHLAHLESVHLAVARGLQAGNNLANHSSATPSNYQEIKERYQTALSQAPAGLLSNNPFMSPVDTSRPVTEQLERFRRAATTLIEATQNWTEARLDNKAMPHPLLGSISVREMLYFVDLHDHHHIAGVQALLKEMP